MLFSLMNSRFVCAGVVYCVLILWALLLNVLICVSVVHLPIFPPPPDCCFVWPDLLCVLYVVLRISQSLFLPGNLSGVVAGLVFVSSVHR